MRPNTSLQRKNQRSRASRCQSTWRRLYVLKSCSVKPLVVEMCKKSTPSMRYSLKVSKSQSATARASTGETRRKPTCTTSRFTPYLYWESKDTIWFERTSSNWTEVLKPTRETVVISQVRCQRREKRISFEPMSFYEERLGHDSVGNRPKCISVIACIFWYIVHANRKPNRFVDRRKCCIQ